MLKKYLAFLLALCLLMTSSVALMEEDTDSLFAAGEILSEELEAPIDEAGEFELGEGLELDEEIEEVEVIEASEPVIEQPAEAPEEVAEAAAESSENTAESGEPAAETAAEAPAEAEETAEPVEEATAEPAVEATAEPVAEATAQPVVEAPAVSAEKTIVAAAATTTQFTLTTNAKTTVSVGNFLQINLAPGMAAKSYKSSKKKVAVVNAAGFVTPRAAGKATITVTLTNKKKLKLTLTVVDPTMPTSVYLSKGGVKVTGTITVNKGTPVQLVPVLNSTLAKTTYKWKTSKKKVATISAAGVITPKKEGTTKITVTTVRGKKKASIKVKVIDPLKATAVRIANVAPVVVPLGSSVQLKAIMAPINSTSTLKWKSANKKIASVSKTGVVTGKKANKTTKITVTTSTKKKATVVVLVTAKLQPAASVGIIVPSGAEKIQRFRTNIFEANVTPYPANANLVWTSSNPNVVKVSKYYRTEDYHYQAELTGVNEGQATITIRDTITGKAKAFNVTCFLPPAPAKISVGSAFTIVRGQAKKACPDHQKLGKAGSWDLVVPYKVLTASNTEECVEHPYNTAKVTMSNPAIATIEYDAANGNHTEGHCAMDFYLHINAKAAGTSTVTITLKNGVSASFTLTVK